MHIYYCDTSIEMCSMLDYSACYIITGRLLNTYTHQHTNTHSQPACMQTMLSPSEWTLTPEAAMSSIHKSNFSGRCNMFLIAGDNEFKRLFIELTTNVLQSNCSMTCYWKNSSPAHTSEWVFDPQVHIDTHSDLVSLDQNSFLWLETPCKTNALAKSQLACTIKTPLNCGEATCAPPIEAFQFLQPWQHALLQAHTKMSFHAVGAVEYHYTI